MSFVMINEGFLCQNCNAQVSPHPRGSARNHCPNCLYSKHLDESSPGDRLSQCHGIMEPIGTELRKNKGVMIKHKCLICGKTMLNKLAPDDAFLEFQKTLIKK